MNIQKKLAIAYILFGIGFAFVLFGFVDYITPTKYKEYTDEEIKARAKELGMVDYKDSLLGNSSEKKEDEKEDENEDENDDENDDGKSKAETEEVTKEEEVKFIIEKNEFSESIVNRLYESGIINDKGEVYKYIRQNKMSRKFRYGEYTLYKGMDYKELINIITIR